jgi:hypothetical protein
LLWVTRNLQIGLDWRSSVKIYSSVIFSSILTLLFVGIQSNPWVRLFGGATIFLALYLFMIKVQNVLDVADYRIFRAILGDTGVLARLLTYWE